MAQPFDPFAKPELLNRTARSREIAGLAAMVAGQQYEKRPDWWTGGDKEVPLRERKPCVIYRLPKAAVNQVALFLFGDGRFPRVSVDTVERGGSKSDKASESKEPSELEEQGPTESEETPESPPATDDLYPAVSEKETEELEAWVSDLIEDANIQALMQTVSAKAIGCRSACIILEAMRGELRATLPDPQDCFPKFVDDDVDGDVEKLVWCYEFEKEVTAEDGTPTCKRYIFRREYDAANVYIYDDVEWQLGQDVTWGAPSVQPHGLSFCPVVWTRNEAGTARGVDGCALIEDSAEEVEALDFTLSKRHQGLVYLGSPQIVETAEELEASPDAQGRTAGPEGSGGYMDGSGKFRKDGGGSHARKMGPEWTWGYLGKNVSVELVETTGKAFEAATLHVEDVRARLLESWSVVIPMLGAAGGQKGGSGGLGNGEMSARFLKLVHAPLIALVQSYRPIWWTRGLRKVLSMAMRMAVDLAASGRRLNIPNSGNVVKILERFYRGGEWVTPRMKPHWGEFFAPSPEETKATTDATVTALEANLISSTTATEAVSHVFGVDDINEEQEEIEDDKTEAEVKGAADAKRQVEALHGMAASIGGAAPIQPDEQ